MSGEHTSRQMVFHQWKEQQIFVYYNLFFYYHIIDFYSSAKILTPKISKKNDKFRPFIAKNWQNEGF